MGDNDTWVLMEDHAQKDPETRYEHYQQYYKDIKVEGYSVLFTFKNDILVRVAGRFVPISTLIQRA